ncbi:MAG: prolyl oligopeptidase family serine peptidase [Gammaproteobacteria bacterium]|nr:prolyl oligopeptidase family serine peptidase [Gammaproteobacteria bacterium]
MKNSPLPLFPVLVLIGAVLVWPPQASGDGPVRTWLKERAERRQQSAPTTGADSQSKITQPGDYSFTITHGGLARKYLVHVPAKYQPATPAAALFALHGGGGNMGYMATDERYGLISKSEREGFIVVFPNGYSKWNAGKIATWNAGGCCGDARDKHIDDVGFIRAVVANVTRQLHVDRHRIFAAGMSNGGMMSYRLACELTDTFSGIAAVAGTDNTTTCQPKRPIPILHIHAQDDDHVLFGGGAGQKAFRDLSKVTDFTSVPATVAKWVKANACDPNPKRILQKPGAYCERYSACQGQVHVQLCVTETGGHSWPGAAKTRGEPASTAISANDVMWDFFMGTKLP